MCFGSSSPAQPVVAESNPANDTIAIPVVDKTTETPKEQQAAPPEQPKPNGLEDVKNKIQQVAWIANYPDQDVPAELSRLTHGYGGAKGRSERERMVRIAAIALARVDMIDNPQKKHHC